MPTKPNKPALPKGRVMYADPTARAYNKSPSLRDGKDYWHTDCVAVLPCRTAKEARAWVKLARMSEGEIRYAIAKRIAANAAGLPTLSDAGFRGMRRENVRRYIILADQLMSTLHLT